MSRPKTYQINELYFESELSKNGAYLLGLIFSDGHLNYDRGVFQYVCKKDDVEIINFIKSELKSTHPIIFYTQKEKEYCRISITNKKLVQSIINKFSMPNKNKSQNNLNIPNIDSILLSDFLRGVFDGDGSIWKSDNYCAGFCGGENFLLQIKELLYNKIGVKFGFRYRYSENNKNSCSIETKGNINITKLYKFLYSIDSVFLKRKHAKFIECINRPNNRMEKMFSYNGKDKEIKIMYKNGFSQKQISKKLDLIYSSVRCFIQRERKKGSLV
jgi:hypothetical protein